jgi:hypothetical protein
MLHSTLLHVALLDNIHLSMCSSRVARVWAREAGAARRVLRDLRITTTSGVLFKEGSFL